MIISNVKEYIEFGITVLLALISMVALFKLLFKKFDKNNNGKIDKEELTNADIQFCKELLKDSIKTIALGIYRNSGLQSKDTYNLMLNEVKKSKNIIEEEIKKEIEKENENEKNS